MRFVAVRVLLVLFLAAFVASIWLVDAEGRKPTPIGWYETDSHTWLCLGPDGKAALFGEHSHPHVFALGTWELRHEGHAVEIRWAPEQRAFPLRWDPEKGRLGSDPGPPQRWLPRESPTWATDVGPSGTAPKWAMYPGSFDWFRGDPWWTRVR